MSRIILSEHDCMLRITSGLATAADGAKMMAAHRPDQSYMWLKLSEAFRLNEAAAWKLAEEAAGLQGGKLNG